MPLCTRASARPHPHPHPHPHVCHHYYLSVVRHSLNEYVTATEHASSVPISALPAEADAMRARVVTRALSTHVTLRAHVQALRLAEFRASAAAPAETFGAANERGNRAADFRLARKLVHRCVGLCEKQTASALNDRPLFDLMVCGTCLSLRLFSFALVLT